MNSLNRTLMATRAMVAELPLGHYLLSTIVGIILLLIHITEVDSSGLNLPSRMSKEILTITQVGAYAFVLFTALLSAVILGVDFVTRELKEEGRSSRLLTLPLSQTERVSAMGVVFWGVFPVLCIFPPFLILCLLRVFGSGAVLLPAPEYFLVAIPLAWAAIILISCLWLFPAIAIPRRGALLFVLLLCAIGIYSMLTREGLSDAAFLNYESTAFLAQDVVGMDNQRVLDNDTLPGRYMYQLPDTFGVSGIIGILSLAGLIVASFLAFIRKTA